jgi:stringent starvation protein B
MAKTPDLTSTRPYLIRAWHEWCSDNGLTPYVTVAVNNLVQVPREFVKDGEIVLNIGYDATTALAIDNEYLAFKARFSGVVKDILVPIDQVMAIFARENGQGMAFVNPEQSKTLQADAVAPAKAPRSVHLSSVPLANADGAAEPESVQAKPPTGRPALTRIK